MVIEKCESCYWFRGMDKLADFRYLTAGGGVRWVCNWCWDTGNCPLPHMNAFESTEEKTCDT